MITRRSILLAALGAALVACTKTDAPVEPVWGKQACAHCMMVLSDRRFGAQLVTRDGDRFYFDDVGCMVLFARERGLESAHAWVHDAESGKWVPAQEARYAPGASTPMDFGFESRAAGDVPYTAMREQVLAKQSTQRSNP